MFEGSPFQKEEEKEEVTLTTSSTTEWWPNNGFRSSLEEKEEEEEEERDSWYTSPALSENKENNECVCVCMCMYTKKEQTSTALLELTRLSGWLHYYNIYLIHKSTTKWKASPSSQSLPEEETMSWVLG